MSSAKVPKNIPKTIQAPNTSAITEKVDFLFIFWTYRESNPDLIHAMDPFCHYTIGPLKFSYAV